MENKKIRNARLIKFDGKKFKSASEVRIYKALKELNIDPNYEENTYVLSPKIRSSVPFYNRTDTKGFHLITEPISQITYTPDFTFTLNGIFVIIEVKGFENDVFPVKRNLFRKYLSKLSFPCMYFEIRSKKELLEAIRIIKMETPIIQRIRTLLMCLPDKDISIGCKYLEQRSFDELHELVDSAITKVARSRRMKADPALREKYSSADLEGLYKLKERIEEYMSKL